MTIRPPPAIFCAMADDIIYALLGLGILILFVYLFFIEPRSSVHPDS
jgi:hypothetical protein